ncbi:hypothetical protein ACFQZ4_08810 [Catellatospora coxensis]
MLRLPPGAITPDRVYTGRHIGRPGAYGPAAADLAEFLARMRDATARFVATGEVTDL